jgi:hypothetical protein
MKKADAARLIYIGIELAKCYVSTDVRYSPLCPDGYSVYMFDDAEIDKEVTEELNKMNFEE